jgi:hypothetical protein
VHCVLIPSPAFSFDIVHTAGINRGSVADDRRSSILVHRQQLFLAEKIDIPLSAGACLDDCRKVERKIVAIFGVVDAEGKRKRQKEAGGEEGSLVRRKTDGEGIDAVMNLHRQQID